ncbi:unnamed protein product, partial [Closterium sp. NIES-53]
MSAVALPLVRCGAVRCAGVVSGRAIAAGDAQAGGATHRPLLLQATTAAIAGGRAGGAARVAAVVRRGHRHQDVRSGGQGAIAAPHCVTLREPFLAPAHARPAAARAARQPAPCCVSAAFLRPGVPRLLALCLAQRHVALAAPLRGAAIRLRAARDRHRHHTDVAALLRASARGPLRPPLCAPAPRPAAHL